VLDSKLRQKRCVIGDLILRNFGGIVLNLDLSTRHVSQNGVRISGIRPASSMDSENSEGNSEISDGVPSQQHTACLFPFCYRADLLAISLSRALELDLARLLRSISN
jgi:hypothetical protein